MAIEVFNRYEKKYMVDERTFDRLIVRLSDYMALDAYNMEHEFYGISNIYYDTPNDELIRRSIEKPVYKEKLRLRAYGVPELDDDVYVEIKKKYKDMVNKRRTSMKLSQAYAYLNENQFLNLEQKTMNRQVLHEIDYFKNFYGLVPKVYIAYDRRAYFEINDGDFRLTFDTNIRTRRKHLRLEEDLEGTRLLPEGQFLMEVKILNAAPMWFAKLMAECDVKPVSFSKYGTEYKNHYLQNKGEENLCLNQFLQQQQTVPYQLAHQC